MTKPEPYHRPVMPDESIEALVSNKDGVYVDATFGGGGHSRKVLSVLGQEGRLIAFDRDEDSKVNAPDDGRFDFVQSDFRYLKNALRFAGISAVDGVLADLGVSSHQFDAPRRGFSIRTEGPLDMRMGSATPLTAATVVNTYSREDLMRVLREYGEVPGAGRVADALIYAREGQLFATTSQLVACLEPLAKRGKSNRFLAQVFQAIRIEVNDELGALRALLLQSAEVIKPGGRLVVLTYHSLEDRPVKRFMKTGRFDGEMQKDFFGKPQRPFVPLKGMPITPKDEELELNNRARSAKLRAATRNDEQGEE